MVEEKMDNGEEAQARQEVAKAAHAERVQEWNESAVAEAQSGGKKPPLVNQELLSEALEVEARSNKRMFMNREALLEALAARDAQFSNQWWRIEELKKELEQLPSLRKKCADVCKKLGKYQEQLRDQGKIIADLKDAKAPEGQEQVYQDTMRKQLSDQWRLLVELKKELEGEKQVSAEKDAQIQELQDLLSHLQLADMQLMIKRLKDDLATATELASTRLAGLQNRQERQEHLEEQNRQLIVSAAKQGEIVAGLKEELAALRAADEKEHQGYQAAIDVRDAKIKWLEEACGDCTKNNTTAEPATSQRAQRALEDIRLVIETVMKHNKGNPGYMPWERTLEQIRDITLPAEEEEEK